MGAGAAGIVGIHRHQRAPFQTARGKIFGQIGAELMARHKRLSDRRGADAAILVVMQVAAAEANRRDIYQNLARCAFAQIEGCDPGIFGGMQEKGTGHGARLYTRDRRN